jgi:predicted DNA-binding transcriptional regulator AlpA
MPSTPKKFHLDKRAAGLAAEVDDDNADDLLDTPETAAWLGVSVEWLENARSRDFGPPYVKMSPRRIRYHRGIVKEWLFERVHRGTSEYDTGRHAGPGRGHKAEVGETVT